MNYLPRNKFRYSYWKKISWLFTCFIVLALILSLFGGKVVSVVSPVWRGEHFLSRFLGPTLEYWRGKQALVDENISLREKVTALEFEKSTLTLALNQEHSLEALLGRLPQPGEVIASVLTRPPQSPYDLFIIDAGERDGIAVGAQAGLPEGPLLGTISDVFASSAKVKLFSSAGEKTEAVLERGNTPVILEGRGGGAFRVKVPRETPAVIGDRIISADTSYRLLGVIEDISVSSTDSFKEISARSPANIFDVRLISVSP